MPILLMPIISPAVSLMTNSVVHLGYPFSGDGSGVGPGSTAVSPIGLEFVLPEKIIISEGIPEIGWWNEVSILSS